MISIYTQFVQVLADIFGVYCLSALISLCIIYHAILWQHILSIYTGAIFLKHCMTNSTYYKYRHDCHIVLWEYCPCWYPHVVTYGDLMMKYTIAHNCTKDSYQYRFLSTNQPYILFFIPPSTANKSREIQ